MARFKLVFFVPRENTQSVLSKLFTLSKDRAPATVGRIGLYEQCAFVSPGVGQFLPMSGANPAIGSVGKVEKVEEDRVETLVVGSDDQMREVVHDLKKVHPYEEVAYDVYRLEEF